MPLFARPASDLCKGLSVNDSFWAERDGENLKFADINLYDNPLDETLAIVAYTGYSCLLT